MAKCGFAWLTFADLIQGFLRLYLRVSPQAGTLYTVSEVDVDKACPALAIRHVRGHVGTWRVTGGEGEEGDAPQTVGYCADGLKWRADQGRVSKFCFAVHPLGMFSQVSFVSREMASSEDTTAVLAVLVRRGMARNAVMTCSKEACAVYTASLCVCARVCPQAFDEDAGHLLDERI